MKKNYALVLGGGGSRGYAHIGVIKYIEKNNINITQTAGTSIGAIISACYAIGKTSIEMEKILKSNNFLRLLNLKIKYGIISGEKVYKFLYEIFGDTLIENTKIPLKIITTNLNTGGKKIFESGKIVDAIRASISLPAIFSPYEIDGEKYIDGGLTSNLPILDVEEKNIIAVSVVREKLKIKTHNEKTKTHNKIFFNFNLKELFFLKNYKILKKSFSMIISNNEDLTIEIAKRDGKNIILLKPDVSKYEYYHFLKFNEIIKKGYECCIDVKF